MNIVGNFADNYNPYCHIKIVGIFFDVTVFRVGESADVVRPYENNALYILYQTYSLFGAIIGVATMLASRVL